MIAGWSNESQLIVVLDWSRLSQRGEADPHADRWTEQGVCVCVRQIFIPYPSLSPSPYVCEADLHSTHPPAVPLHVCVRRILKPTDGMCVRGRCQ